jgi:hypothetical protein
MTGDQLIGLLGAYNDGDTRIVTGCAPIHPVLTLYPDDDRRANRDTPERQQL